MPCGRCWPGQTTLALPQSRCPCPATEAPACSRGHEKLKSWLEQALSGPESVGLPEQVLASVVRLVTNHRIYQDPSTPSAALSFCDSLMEAPAAMRVRPGERHWGIFHDLVSQHGLRGNDIPDAYLAALALEQGATWMTTDVGSRATRDCGCLTL